VWWKTAHWTWMKLIHVRFTIMYSTWIGFISDLPPTVNGRYTFSLSTSCIFFTL
jgi:hypothetical protein